MKCSMMSQPDAFVHQNQQIKVYDAAEKAPFESDPAIFTTKSAGVNMHDPNLGPNEDS